MGLVDWLMLILLIFAAVWFFKPEIYDNTAGVVVDKAIDIAKDKFDGSSVEVNVSEVIDLGLPYLYDNLTFTKCGSNNLCERLFGSQAMCNLTSGHCYK